MRRSRRALANAFWSVAQVGVNGLLYLVLYRFLFQTIGLNALGVWSLVMAWTSVNNVASFGLGGGTTYFIPKYLARGDRAYVTQLIQTGTLTTAVAIAGGLLVFYPLVVLILDVVISSEEMLPAAYSILPYAFASVWLSATAAIVYASLDGCQRVDLRNAVLVVGAATFLGAAFVLVPGQGLVGLAKAQLLQAAVVLVASWGLLRRLVPELPWVPRQWSRAAFREMIGYSIRFQGVTLSQMLFEPMTKSLLSAFGGVGAAGVFEMANRLVVQLRAFVMTAHTAIVPTLTDIGETTPELLRDIYETSSRLMAFFLALALPFLLAVTPLTSRLWLGTLEPTFVVYMMLLVMGWFGNLVVAPAYVAYLGAGELRWVLRSHLVTAFLNAALGLALGALLGGRGVVLGFVIALLGGSLMVPVAFERDQGTDGWRLWVSGPTVLLAACAAAGAGLVLAATRVATGSPLILAGATFGIFAAATLWPAWRHPVRRQLDGWVRSALHKRAASAAGALPTQSPR